jgi:hypothetical protein
MRAEPFDKLGPARVGGCASTTQRALAVENSAGSLDLWMP